MIIKTETTNNKNVKNFYPEQKLAVSGNSEYADAKALRKSPLAEAIFDIGGIESVLIAPDMVSVIKAEVASWDDLSPQIMAEILDFAATGADAVVAAREEETSDDLMKKISGLVAARIRPALNKDGGDIIIKKFNGGVLYVELTGKCAGCPYAMRTLKDGVEKILKNYIPEVLEVRPFSETD